MNLEYFHCPTNNRGSKLKLFKTLPNINPGVCIQQVRVHRVFNLAQHFFVKGHHVVNGGKYVNQMVRRVDYSAHMVNTALKSTRCEI